MLPITLVSTIYEANFKQHLKENLWFRNFKSKYITKKRLIINNLDSTQELEDILNEFYDPSEVELVYVEEHSDRVIQKYNLNIDKKQQDEVYFAQKKAEDCAGILLAKGDSFFNILRANAYLEKMSRMWRAYHGAYSNDLGYGHRVEFSGEQGELVMLPVNHFANIAQHIYTMITANRPIMEARAVNTDYKSLAQTYIANGVLDYYMREKHLESCLKKAAEMAIVLGAGFVKLDWNATAGEAYDADPETGEMVYEGELEFTNLSPFDVVVDGTKETWNNEWILTRSFQNRYNLISKYPELKDKLLGVKPKNQSAVYRLAVFSNDDTDDIPVYEFYHKRTEAMPDGRYMLFVDSDIVLLDTKMPYRVLPVFRITPREIMGTPYGYTPMYDIFPIQEGINSLYSTIMTNQNAFGVQNLFVPRGSDLSIESLDGAMNIVEGNAKPEPLQLTATPPEVFNFLNMLIQSAETISGVNSVTRGNPEASLKSGTALALVQSMSLQYISGLQQSYVKLIEDVGTAIVQILKDFAMTPKVIALVGKNNRPLLKEFTGDQISAINRVVVDIGNPLSRTIAGRVQMAEQMLQMNLIKSPEQYFQVINTGKIETMFEGEMNELLLIKSENEQMLEGKDVIVSPLDKHRLHINEHKAVLSDPDLRRDQTLVKVVLDHIEDHLNALRETDPALLQLVGEQPLPPIGMEEGPLPGQEMPPNQAMQGSPMDQLLASQGGNVQSGETIRSMTGQNVQTPNMPRPPAPFENMPVSPEEMI